MSLGSSTAVAIRGIGGQLVDVQADIGKGLPGIYIVGLPDTAVHESRLRLRAAFTNAGLPWPRTKIVLSLSPASLPKRGSGYDLALAMAILSAAGEVPAKAIARTVFVGELSLDGAIRPVRGVLPCVLAARDHGSTRIVVPAGNFAEACAVGSFASFGASNLGEVVAWARGTGKLHPDIGCDNPPLSAAHDTAHLALTGDCEVDFADIRGQDEARHAVEIAAAGGHNMYLAGPPGTGKTMLAQRLPTVLPNLCEQQSLEVSAVHSVAGLLDPAAPLVTRPPFVAPHHTATRTALVGGGSGTVRPGAVSLAHHGVLLLDECPEMSVRILDALRTPLDEGEVRLARSDGLTVFPARSQLVLASNYCPCAAADPLACSCSVSVRRRYLSRLSGPLLDRIDLRIHMNPLGSADFYSTPSDNSALVRERVAAARERSAHRWADARWSHNGAAPGPAVRKLGVVSRAAARPIDTAVRRGVFSIRGADRCLRLALTIADLDGADSPNTDHVLAAIALRGQIAP